MNITYIIGNGFDLGLGLNTQYSNFVEFLVAKIKRYLESNEKAWNSDEKMFAEWLLGRIEEQKIEFWHDAEEAFGNLRFGIFQGREQDVVQFCHSLFQSEMAAWIAQKNALFAVPKGRESEIGKKFMEALLHGWRNGLSDDARSDIDEQLTNGPIDIKILSFNYTDCIEKLIVGIDEVIEALTTIGILKQTLNIHPPIHVHGKVDAGGRRADLVFGVNDEEQITGVETTENDEIRSRLIKGRYLDYMHKRSEQEADNILFNSNWVIVLGHSFGKTDGRWWRRIYDHIGRDHFNLVICPYYAKMEYAPSDVSDPIRYRRMSAARVFASIENVVGNKIYAPEFMRHIHALEPVEIKGPGGGSHYCDYLNLTWLGKQCISANETNKDAIAAQPTR